MRCPPPLIPLLVAPLLFGTGCAAGAAVGSILGAGFSGLTYFADGNTERTRTFVVPLPEVWRASVSVLRLMDLTISEGTRNERTGELTGTAPDLSVTVTMRSVTARATRVSIECVAASYGEDQATAAEVLNQLALLLPPAASAPSRPESD